MADRPSINTKGFDWITLSFVLALIAIGWIMIYAVEYNEQNPASLFDLNTSAGKQLLFIGVAAAIFMVIQIMDARFWRIFAFIIYVISLLLLVGVLFLGSSIKGATAWYQIGGFSFQPSEVAKFGTCLALSSFLSAYSTNLKQRRYMLMAIGIIAVPQIIIMLQPDAGSALVFLSFFIVLYRAGLESWIYALFISIAALFVSALLFETYNIVLFLGLGGIALFGIQLKQRNHFILFFIILCASVWFTLKYGYQNEILVGLLIVLIITGVITWLQGNSRTVLLYTPLFFICSGMTYAANWVFQNMLQAHQQERINVWLHPERCDPRGSLYNVLQSKLAIGSGGLNGKGFLQGTLTKLNYVPEQSTDFIFCTVGEEQGFIGSMVVLGIFLALILRLFWMAERQKLEFSRHYLYGVAGILFFHVIINIGMTIGLVPIIGIPLPFMSYGGSSMMGFTLLMSLAIKLDADRNSGYR